MRSIQLIVDSYLCSACGACSSVCPKGAISYAETNIGRKHAVVSNDCIDCGICQKSCPTLNYEELTEKIDDRFVGQVNGTYIGRATDNEIYRNSQSGGSCTALLKHLFETQRIDGAIVCRMEYGNVPVVKPVLITNANDLLQTQKSNYTQVPLLSILRETENLKSVAMVGIPCQIEAIKSIQKNLHKYTNIKFFLGLICDRSLCGAIQDVYSKRLDGEQNSIKIGWRAKFIDGITPKSERYKNAPLIVYSKEGKHVKLSNIYRFALKDMFTPPKCRTCEDKLNALADVTLGDPWKMSGVDWENGESLIISRTAVGQEIIDACQRQNYISVRQASLSEVIKGQNIEQRRVSTAKFKKAIEKITHETARHSSEVEKEINTLRCFQKDEQKSRRRIIRKALWTVRKEIIISKLKSIIRH